jgi:hypothetical protein
MSMPELAERIRDYVDIACPAVSVEEITARLGSGEREGKRGEPPKRRRRRVALLSTAVSAVLVVVLIVQLLPGSGPHAGTEAEAALARVASVAAAQPAGLTPGPGRYLYYETSQTMTASTPQPPAAQGFLFEQTRTTQTWVAPDGTGRQRITTSQPRLVFPNQHAAWEAAGSHPPLLLAPGIVDTRYPSTQAPNGGPLVTSHGAWYLSYLNSSRFPTAPGALQKYMDRYFKIYRGSPSATFELAGNVLQVGARPALRSAIFGLIEHLRGVTLVGWTKDATGRSGIGVAIAGFGNRTILVFDPNTSAVLGEKTVAVKTVSRLGALIPKGTVLGSETYGVTGIAPSTTKYPNGQSAPAFKGDTSTGPPSEALFGFGQGG